MNLLLDLWLLSRLKFAKCYDNSSIDNNALLLIVVIRERVHINK